MTNKEELIKQKDPEGFFLESMPKDILGDQAKEFDRSLEKLVKGN